jgi:hypothetical protein
MSPSSHYGQSPGISTAESECSSSVEASPLPQIMDITNEKAAAYVVSTSAADDSNHKRTILSFSALSKRLSSKQLSSSLTKSSVDLKIDTSLIRAQRMDQSLSNSAPTILILGKAFETIPSEPIRSIMTNRTLHESLHRGKSNAKPSYKLHHSRSVSFGTVDIREHERVLGDNPSVRSGPPLSLGWKSSLEPISMKVEDYEKGKGEARSSSEYLVPKAVRERLLKEHAGVSRRDIAEAVRHVNKSKAQRKKTVVNLSMSKTEEKLETAKRQVKKILKARQSYNKEEARLWDEAHAAAMDKAKKLEESIRKGESVSMRNVYEVGTPCNDFIIPSKKNCSENLVMLGWESDGGSGAGGDGGGDGDTLEESKHSESTPPNAEEHEVVSDVSLVQKSDDDLKNRYVPALRRKSYSGPSSEDDMDVSSKRRSSALRGRGDKNHRHSESDISTASATQSVVGIVASENDDSDDILAKLLLDDS